MKLLQNDDPTRRRQRLLSLLEKMCSFAAGVFNFSHASQPIRSESFGKIGSSGFACVGYDAVTCTIIWRFIFLSVRLKINFNIHKMKLHQCSLLLSFFLCSMRSRQMYFFTLPFIFHSSQFFSSRSCCRCSCCC